MLQWKNYSNEFRKTKNCQKKKHLKFGLKKLNVLSLVIHWVNSKIDGIVLNLVYFQSQVSNGSLNTNLHNLHQRLYERRT